MKFSFNTKQPKKPWFAWIFWIIGFMLLNLVLLVVQEVFGITTQIGSTLVQYLCEIGIIIIALVINHCYTKEPLMFKRWNIFAQSFLLDFYFIYYLWGILVLHNEMHHILLYGILALLIGIAEELSFRGVLLSSFIHNWKGRHPLVAGILLSSLLFGATHAMNALSQPLPNTIVQMFVAFSLGVILAIMYLRTANLTTPILFHAMIDFTSISISNTTESQTGWGPVIPLLIVALITLFTQLRPAARQQIKQDFNV